MICDAAKQEEVLRAYLAEFNGTQKDFAEVESLFRTLFRQKYVLISRGRETITKEEMKQLHSNHLSRGSYANIIKSRRIGKNCIDVEFSIESKVDSEATCYRILSRPWRRYALVEEQNRARRSNMSRDSITLSCARLSVGM